MFAIVKHGNKQYIVKKNDIIDIDVIDIPSGATIHLEKIALVSEDTVVLPNQLNISQSEETSVLNYITATVIKPVRGKKVVSFYHKRRKHHRRIKGHVQEYTRIQIVDIQ